MMSTHFPCSASRGFHNGATLYCSLDFGHDTPCDFVVDSRSFAGAREVYMGYEWPYDEETEEEKKMHIDPTVAVAYGVAIVFSALVLLSYFRRDK